MSTNCAEGTLAAYVPSGDMPWNQQRAMHLARRMAMGANNAQIEQLLSADPGAVVNQLVQEAVDRPLATAPEWAEWQVSDYPVNEDDRNAMIVDQIFSWATLWIKDIKNNGLRDRMSWFWHNHFVTKLDSYFCPSWLYQYHKLLQQFAVGNFKEFVREIGITPAMLVYLNNVQNTSFEPNENYARELYELFTLGVDNGYTQSDIVDTARAITGWNDIDVNDLCGTIDFLPFAWDAGEKTIFGQTGNWGYNDVIDLLFEHRAVEISQYICGKLYRHFVNPREDEDTINALAQIFRDSDFELAPVLQAMFSSEHFFDEANIGTVIPGHIELFLGFLNELNFPEDDTLLFTIAYSADDYDQRIFNPTDVAGWPGNRAWITSPSLQYRWEAIRNIMGYYYDSQGESLQLLTDFAVQLAGAGETDPAVISRKIVDYLLPKQLQFDTDYDEAARVFKAIYPENYYDGQWNLGYEYVFAQVFELINHIANLPEFQLR